MFVFIGLEYIYYFPENVAFFFSQNVLWNIQGFIIFFLMKAFFLNATHYVAVQDHPSNFCLDDSFNYLKHVTKSTRGCSFESPHGNLEELSSKMILEEISALF